jgi:Ni/Co efflux regulator RcnB
MSSRFLIVSAAAAAALVLPTAVQAGVIGCDASGNRQVAGALIGGVLGGVIGNNVVRKDQQAGTIVGAASGAAAGSYVGCEMQKSDAREPEPRPTARRAQPAYVEEDRRPVVRTEDPRRPVYVDGDRRYDRDERPVYVVSEPGPRKRHPHGMPPGQARKYYAVGERMPVAYVSDRAYIIYEPARYRLRPAPAGYRWMFYGDDAYLVRTETGLVSEVIRSLLR